MSEMKYLLLVDDNRNDLELTLRVLQSQKPPHSVVVACDGVEALDFLYRRGQYSNRNSDNPTVVVLDLKMPRLDGFDVLQQIKNDPQLRSIPVVMFTSSNQSGDVFRCYELGANAYVVKPMEYQEFVSTVKEIGTFWTHTNQTPPLAAERAA